MNYKTAVENQKLRVFPQINKPIKWIILINRICMSKQVNDYVI